ncbi:MAG: histidyl-tRNA synthetase [Bacteroidota bacterium]|nr:histidyl-tRNA synthetase [Bacteroidota bacterium]
MTIKYTFYDSMKNERGKMIQTIRGTKDLLPDVINQWHFVESQFRKVSSNYGYSEIRTPIFEKTEVFSRSIGEETDIVNKEMYTFTDKGGESVTLRPEMTAALVRAVIQNSLLQQSSTLKLWYFGPFFRYERPQKGRLRQFHQYGAECLLSPYPESDAEVVFLANDIIKSIGINDYALFYNTLGNAESRKNYRNELLKYFRSVKDNLSTDSLNRLENNPLRILDSKDERDIDIVRNAPLITESLDNESLDYFRSFEALIENSGIKLVHNPRLVRGLDYYNHIVFEFQNSSLGAQDSFGGGGRYNDLFEQLGSKQSVPAVGFALGVERMLLILEQNESLKLQENIPDVFIIATSTDLLKQSRDIAAILRARGLQVIVDLQRRSVKAQMREANRNGAKFTIIVGDNEIARNIVIVKEMATGSQSECPLANIVHYPFS